MNYQWHYEKLIETRRNRSLKEDEYYERHHIIPRSLGGSNSSENLIKLTAREHFLAHWLLKRMYKDVPIAGAKMAGAFAYMCNNHVGKFTLSSRAFAEGREASSLLASDRSYWKKRKPMSQEQKDKISKAMSERNVTEETKEKMRENFKQIQAKNPRKKSEEDRKRISQQKSNMTYSEVAKKNMSEAAIRRWKNRKSQNFE